MDLLTLSLNRFQTEDQPHDIYTIYVLTFQNFLFQWESLRQQENVLLQKGFGF